MNPSAIQGVSSRITLARSIVLSGSTFLAQVLAAGAVVWVARQVTVAQFGSFALVLSVCTWAANLIDFGSGVYTLRLFVRNEIAAPQLVGFVIRRTLLSAPVLLLLAGCIALVKGETWYVVLAAYSMGLSAQMVLNSGLRAQAKFWSAGMVIVGDRLCMLATLFFLDSLGLTPLAAISIAFATGTWLGCAGAFVRMGAERPDLFPKALGILQTYRNCRFIGTAALFNDLTLLETPFVAAFGGAVAAGQYGVATRFTGPLGIPASALSQSVGPDLARAFGNRDLVRQILKMASPVGAAIFVLLTSVFLVSPLLIDITVGTQYGRSSAFILRILCICVALSALSQILLVIAQGQDLDKSYSRAFVIAMPIGLVVTAIGTTSFGAKGAVFGPLVAQVFVLANLIKVVRAWSRPLGSS